MIENLKCPECDGPMTSRKNSTTGQRFWGCNRYPKCRGTRDTDGESKVERERQVRAAHRPLPFDASDARAPSERQRDNDRERWRQP